MSSGPFFHIKPRASLVGEAVKIVWRGEAPFVSVRERVTRKYFLRDVATGKFFRSFGHWTTDLESAFDFEERDRALRVIQELRMAGTEVVQIDGPEEPMNKETQS